jgi:trehalose synthase
MLRNVPVSPLPIERFRAVLDDAGYRDLLALRDRAQRLFAGRVIWCVNSTATGGGVAEMLRSLLAYTRGAGVDTRWLVLNGTPEFFAVTKGLHNRLHAASGELPPLGEDERAAYEAVTVPAARQLAEMVRPGDVVLLHDPQTLGMAPVLRECPVGIVWRVHVGVDEPDDRARAAWDFLRPYTGSVDTCVFSREQFVWEGLEHGGIEIVPPSIDVFSAKNQELDDASALAVLHAAGIVADGHGPPGMFLREDGTPARVDRRATLVQERELRAGDRYVTQVSRWDRLKDPVGVLEGFVQHVGEECVAQVLLVGPDVAGVSDDTEGAELLE